MKHSVNTATTIRDRLLTLHRRDGDISNLLLMMGVVLLVIAILKPAKFYTFNNFQSMSYQFPQFGLLAIGIMLTMITGGIDLSVVGIANLSAIAAALTMKALVPASAGGAHVLLILVLSCVVALCVGFITGLVNGLLVSTIGIPAILATLGSMQLFTGISIILTQGRGLNRLPPLYPAVGNAAIFGIIPVPLIVFLIFLLLVGVLLKKTTYGPKIYMLGTNATAARFSGLNIRRLLNQTYIYSGILSSVAGLIMMARLNSAKADYGLEYTLQCILIVILGGVKPEGGFGRIGGVLLAILILQFLSSAINMFPYVSNFYKLLIWGLVLLLVMIFKHISTGAKRTGVKA
ncbi:MAG: ABC transporter permease [Spirochaetia bacterium]|jgi:simple sugar transport system permease protein